MIEIIIVAIGTALGGVIVGFLIAAAVTPPISRELHKEMTLALDNAAQKSLEEFADPQYRQIVQSYFEALIKHFANLYDLWNRDPRSWVETSGQIMFLMGFVNGVQKMYKEMSGKDWGRKENYDEDQKEGVGEAFKEAPF
ncbi:MAG: hypothetical protein QXI19_02140 [Candidatus Caldarchaeum sp.]